MLCLLRSILFCSALLSSALLCSALQPLHCCSLMTCPPLPYLTLLLPLSRLCASQAKFPLNSSPLPAFRKLQLTGLLPKPSLALGLGPCPCPCPCQGPGRPRSPPLLLLPVARLVGVDWDLWLPLLSLSNPSLVLNTDAVQYSRYNSV